MVRDSKNEYLLHHPTLGIASGSKIDWLSELLEPVLPLRKDARILEIGPGKGEALVYLTKVKGYTHLGAIDNSRDVINLCNQIENVKTVLVDDAAEYLSQNQGKFDLVIMYHVLEHFPKSSIVPTLSAIKTALSPSGQLFIGVPNAAAPIIGADQYYFDFTHETAFSPWSLEQALSMSGFTNIRVVPVWPPKGGIARSLQRFVQKSTIAVMRTYLRIFTGVPRPVLTHSMVAYAK